MSVAVILWPNTLNSMGDNAVLRSSIICKRILGARRLVYMGPHPIPICTATEYMGRIYRIVQQCNLNIWEGKAFLHPIAQCGLCQNVLLSNLLTKIMCCALYCSGALVHWCSVLHSTSLNCILLCNFWQLQQLHVKSGRLGDN